MTRLATLVASSALSLLVWATPGGSAKGADPFLILQSTTSTQNSGLLDHLLPRFHAASGIEVRAVIVGTGQALRNGRNGDGDVLLVHAKSAEEAFVAEGYGVQRHEVMYNDFVLVGPAEDPAKVVGENDAAAAFIAIAAAEHLFVSRGDDSGTHKKERLLWESSGVDAASASGSWYREVGAGMGATLNAAVGMGAYTLSDRGTWISFRNKGAFRVLLEGDPELFNPYGVILVNPERHPRVRAEAGQAFIDWLLSDEGQGAIGEFQLDGQQLFYPNASVSE